MLTSTDLTNHDVGVLAIIRLRRHAPPMELLDALMAGGITRLEVTLPTPNALLTISRWQQVTQVQVGAGTVRTAAQAVEAINAGAQFLVTPTFDADVLDTAATAGRPVYCGASTPTEIERAYRHPAVAAVKVFPVGPLGGVGYIKAIAEPLENVAFLPTGGVHAETVAAYAALGCVGVGVGSELSNDGLVSSQAWDEVRNRVTTTVNAWQRGMVDQER